MSMVTEQQMIDVRDIREKCIENIEVLSKVKKLFLIPKMEVMTTKMVADYYEVNMDIIRQCYLRNKEEINLDGVVKKKISDFNESDNLSHSLIKTQHNISFKIDGYEIVIPNCGILCFSQRAILRIGMLLRDSVIAKEVRTQLLNTFENSTEEQKTSSIDEEMILQANVGKAYMSGNLEEFAKASMEYNAFQNRHMVKLENEKLRLTEINKGLEAENALLAHKTMEWGNKAILNALIRKFTSECFGNDSYSFSNAWNSFYRYLKYKHGYDIPNRHTAKKMIDRITEDEFPNAIAVAVSLLKSNGIDVVKVINVINAEMLVNSSKYNTK